MPSSPSLRPKNNRFNDIRTIAKPIVNIGTLIFMERTDFGARMLLARTQAGLSQEQAREKIGIAQSTLAGLERTAHKSGYTVAFAALYQCNAHWLATGEGDPNFKGRDSKWPFPRINPEDLLQLDAGEIREIESAMFEVLRRLKGDKEAPEAALAKGRSAA